MRIRTFRGLVPPPALAPRVACVPYDVINSAEAAELARGNPHSLLHVIRPEIDLPPGTDLYDNAVYAKGVENFRRFQAEGTLVRENAPCLYLYRQQWQGRSQRGFAVLCHVGDYEDDIIKKHEKTRPDKEDDRTRITSELSANPEPVFLTYRQVPALTAAMDAIEARPPRHDFTAPDGVRHTVWPVTGAQAADIAAAFAAVPVAYVADGHHRSASAARVGRERAAANPAHTGHEDYNWFLAVLFPAPELTILPYNRLVTTLQGLTPETFLAECARRFRLSPGAPPSPATPRHVSLYLQGRWHGLAWDEDPAAGPLERLDVSVLQDRLLAPVLGIDDPRTSRNIEFIGGIRGTDALARAVDSGRAAAAFSLHPVTVGQLMDIADAGGIMPPKSTWFEPKLRSGLFLHTF